MEFPVETLTGSRHDLDELSSGEKEILYGYLRIRNSAPRYSIILLDEPELHLNPRLIRGLPEFYRKNLGETLGNQMWLVTHSDALLREVVGRETYNVFHMLPCATVPKGQSQLKPLSATADLEMALVDLVGDLAAYRPGGKVVIFEGGGDSDFDQRVTSTLFPKLQEQANLISGSNKIRVRALQETLQSATEKGQLPFQFFSITDKDSGTTAKSTSGNIFSWDVYHIENYFLESKFIARVLSSLNMGATLTEEAITDELRQCAQDTLPQLIRHELAEGANAALVGAINTGTDPKGADLSNQLHQSISRSLARLTEVCNTTLAKAALDSQESQLRERYTESLADGTWISKCRGRDVLKRFAGKHAPSVSYEVFRNLLLAQMKDHDYQPPGMALVVEKILSMH